MALCAVSGAVCGAAAAADFRVCVYEPARGVYAAELRAVFLDERGGEYVHLLDCDSDADDDCMSAVGLSGGVYHGDCRTEDAGCDGDAVHSADVDQLPAAYVSDGGVV